MAPFPFLVILLVCYLIGAIPFGLLLTRLAGAGDIRQTGSGNIGATNVYRSAGRRLGILTLILDMLKGALPFYLCQKYFPLNEIQIGLLALALFLGHCYPVYLRFKGGKGVATALGIFLVMNPLAVLEALLLFVFIVWKSRYVSMGSISAACVTPLLIFMHMKSLPLLLACLLIGLIVIYRHRENIERIVRGTEPKLKL
ncbi:MAG: glycerol-3-phosphate 1-O-acyltransferase PlsY [Desulfuromonadaceae bacterium]|nr:glycerol-3-phosphate 1-O-acyltransferase PlsY [Desulfuromonadaceae bacterium]